ncbi:MAG: hypothetical protein F6J87_16135 [Spirulina sp. SIO3F2]|nr:hypothetical protein [Spirulina sp. SIO3F2]
MNNRNNEKVKDRKLFRIFIFIVCMLVSCSTTILVSSLQESDTEPQNEVEHNFPTRDSAERMLTEFWANQQRAYYLEHGKFASTLKDMGLLDSMDDSYSRLLIFESSPTKNVHILSKPNVRQIPLRSYITSVFVISITDEPLKMVSGACESEMPQITSSVMPQLSANRSTIDCPEGFSRVKDGQLNTEDF